MKTFNKVLAALHFTIVGMSIMKIVETSGGDKIAFGVVAMALIFGLARLMKI